MPEAPELEVVKDFLADRLVGVSVESATVLKPSVLRSLCGDVAENLPGGHSRACAGAASSFCLGCPAGACCPSIRC